MIEEIYLTVLPFKKGDVIRHQVGTGRLSLVVSSKSETFGTTLTLVTLSRWKFIRVFQKLYYLKIKTKPTITK